MSEGFFVYCLATIEQPIRTYIGATVNLQRRLRQHNKELKGGARRTSARPGEWYRVCYVRGFNSWQEALQFEWRWKWFSRARQGAGARGKPLEGRALALEAALAWWKEQKGGELEVVAGEEVGGGIAEENAPMGNEDRAEGV
jgi:predicted GIY-YIG superfamily endonuclease